MPARRALPAVVLAVMLLLAACGETDAPAAADARLTVVTTVAPITDLVERVAGPGVAVIGLVPPGVDSHTYEPRPRDARALAEADLVIVNGLFLEEPTLALAEANVPTGTPIVALAEQVVSEDEWVFDFTFPEEEGVPNPHLWTNPVMGATYAEIVRDTLSEQDPDNAARYMENAARYQARLEALDEELRGIADGPGIEHNLVIRLQCRLQHPLTRQISGAVREPFDFPFDAFQVVARLVRSRAFVAFRSIKFPGLIVRAWDTLF
jgi:ABC-type Zn uptake system ZnuABC Zn-binding protein ZnuA